MPEFVHSEGLSCLIRVGAAADHNYQTYILRGKSNSSPMTPAFSDPLLTSSCLCVPSTRPADAFCGWDARGGGPQ